MFEHSERFRQSSNGTLCEQLDALPGIKRSSLNFTLELLGKWYCRDRASTVYLGPAERHFEFAPRRVRTATTVALTRSVKCNNMLHGC